MTVISLETFFWIGTNIDKLLSSKLPVMSTNVETSHEHHTPDSFYESSFPFYLIEDYAKVICRNSVDPPTRINKYTY